jgi:FixJ family two-component response regulator
MRIVFKAGAYDVVDKPYRADALVEMVAREITEARRESNVFSTQ